MSYKIADALRILDLGEEGRDRLFYWIKHKRLKIKLEEEGKGRGKRSSLSFMNIFELAVIKELANLGIELSFIGDVLKSSVTATTEGGKGKLIKEKHFARYLDSVYDSYRKEAKKNEDFYVLIYKDKKNNYQFLPIGPFSFIERLIKSKKFNLSFNLSNAIAILNLYKILREIEKKTGERI